MESVILLPYLLEVGGYVFQHSLQKQTLRQGLDVSIPFGEGIPDTPRKGMRYRRETNK